MAAATTRPEKVIGWPWSSPAQVLAMAEIVVAPGTSEETRAAVVALARLCGNHPVALRHHPHTRRHLPHPASPTPLPHPTRTAPPRLPPPPAPPPPPPTPPP